jgi:hypothetical protein
VKKTCRRLCTALGAFKVFMVLQILSQTVLAPILPWLGKAGNIVIALWAACILLYDLFHERKLFRRGLKIWIVIFLAAVAISIVVNRVNLLDNVEGYVMLVIQLMVLLPAYRDDREQLRRDLRLFVNGLALAMFIASAIGMILYALDKPLYLYSYRFSGVFSNPNMASVMCFWGMVASLVALTDPPTWHPKLYRALHILNTVFCLVLYTVANSNMGKVMLMAAIGVYAFFLPFSMPKIKRFFPRLLTGVGFAAVGCVAAYLLFVGVQTAASYVPGVVRYVRSEIALPEPEQPGEGTANPQTKPAKPVLEKENFDRSEDNVQLDNNRLEIWREGLIVLRHHPLFGCGPRNLWGAVQTYVDNPRPEIEAGGLHNMYLELLSTSGAVGFIPFMIWLAMAAAACVRYLARSKNLRDRISHRGWLLGAGAAAFAVMNLSESVMLFSTNAYSMCFFVTLGFLLNWIAMDSREKENTKA